MRSHVIILSQNDADCRAITEAALSHGCKIMQTGSAREAASFFPAKGHALLFCDASLSEGGGALHSLVKAQAPSGLFITLIVPSGIKPGLLRALKPWAHDYLTTPVLREAAAARIKNVLQEKQWEQTADCALQHLEGWLNGMEAGARCFEPFAFKVKEAQDDVARRLLRTNSDEQDKPGCLMLGVPDGRGFLLCDLYTAGPSGAEGVAKAALRIPESAIFLRIKEAGSLFCLNSYDRGVRLADFQSAFPPDLLEITGAIRNLTGFLYDGRYVVALNYGRPVQATDALFLRGLSLPVNVFGSVSGTMRDLSQSFLVMVDALALATDSKGDNGAHVRRMNSYAHLLAEELNLEASFVRTLSYSAQLHDVGKIYIHPDVLGKPLRLTNHEFDLVKKHPLFGAQILGDSPLLRVAKNIALTHHESWDGSGYPAGLSGDAIPLEGAIVKVADVYDALRTMHTYKASYSHDDALRFILRGGGDDLHEIRPSQFHPEVLGAFQQAAEQFDGIYQNVR